MSNSFTYKDATYSNIRIVDPITPAPLFVFPMGRKSQGFFIAPEEEGKATAIGIRSEADAHLYAAAPDLLKELKTWREFAKNNGWTDKDCHYSDGSGWISATDAAIAKAEGK